MFARPSYRFTFLLLATLILLSFFTLLESWLKTYTKQKISIISPPVHEPNPPPKAIKVFWAEWADALEKARPKIEKIKVQNVASTDRSDQANSDRVPSPYSLGMSTKDVESMQKSQKLLLDRLKNFDKEKVKGIFSGTGVVTVAGGEYFAPAITSILMLRKTGSKLPVHVFLQSRAEYEYEVCEDYLPTLDAECFVLEDFLRDHTPFSVTHYQLKALAILFSPFETILYLDSDCMPLRNPSELLSTEPFASTGLLAWPDYWISTEDPIFYTIAGMESFPEHVPARASEAGQLLISKDKHLPSLLLTAYYNVFGPNYFYPILSQGAAGEGDKETFLAAAIVLGKPYFRVRHRVGTVGYHDEEGVFKGGAMVQHHAGDEYKASLGPIPENQTTVRPFFLHANIPKMNLGHLVDEPGLTTHSGARRRLWGPKESQEQQLGLDFERAVWHEMISAGCALQGVLRDWHGRDRVCERGREHWDQLYRKKDGT